MMIKTIIIEDEINARKALENMLSFYCPEIVVSGHASSIEEGIIIIQQQSPQLLLLDVHLSDGTGFDLIKKLKKKNLKIVFVTAHDQYALQAIKMSALDYLLKPVKPSELCRAIAKVEKALENEEQISIQIDTAIHNLENTGNNKKIILNTNDKMFVLEISQIVHCEAQDNYSKIYINGKETIMISKTLKELEEMLLSYGFFRIHQSHLINLNYVETFEKKGSGQVRITTGGVLPVSVRKKEGFFKALKAFV